MAITLHGLTLDEFLALPEEKPTLEYFDGVVTQKVAPLGEHSALQLELAEYLNRLLRPGKIARAFTELWTTYGGASRVPDVALYRWERIPRTPGGRVASRFLLPPDLAVEIITPGEMITDLTDKCRWYVQHSVQVALLVDPRDETIRVHYAGTDVLVYRRGDHVTLDEIAPGVTLDVDAIFRALDAD